MNEIEKAIKEIENLKRVCVNNLMSTSVEKAQKDYKESIHNCNTAIKVLEKQLNNGWISVSERLPNEKECNRFDDIRHPNYRKFLCTIKIADYESQTRELYLSKVFDWKYGPEDYNEYVIAWQPLMEPYIEAEKYKEVKSEQ